MQISVRSGGFGPMGGAVAALGVAAGVLAVMVPVFRPIAAGSIVMGAAVAGILIWRHRRASRPSISRHGRD